MDEIKVVEANDGMIGIYLDGHLIYSAQNGGVRLEDLFVRLGFEAETVYKEDFSYPLPDKFDIE